MSFPQTENAVDKVLAEHKHSSALEVAALKSADEIIAEITKAGIRVLAGLTEPTDYRRMFAAIIYKHVREQREL